MPILEFELPVRVESEANKVEHWTKKHHRKKWQQAVIRAHWLKLKPKITLPAQITFIRLAPRKLDSDNLPVAFKFCRDEIADLLIPGLNAGQADADPRLTWNYAQEKGNYTIRILIEHNGQ